MDCIAILVQAASTAAASDTKIVPLDFIWEQVTTLSWLQAVITISFGVVYLLYGWRIFKVLVMICSALVGLYAGIKIGAQIDQKLWGGVVGLVVLAAVSLPLMRWAVCILGAIAGGILTGGLWYAFGLPEKFILAGAAIGLVAGGMISFIIFKIAVMLFTSLGGGILIITGALSLLHQYESGQSPPSNNIHHLFYNYKWFVPVLLMAPTIIGVIVQNKFIRKSSGWNI